MFKYDSSVAAAHCHVLLPSGGDQYGNAILDAAEAQIFADNSSILATLANVTALAVRSPMTAFGCLCCLCSVQYKCCSSCTGWPTCMLYHLPKAVFAHVLALCLCCTFACVFPPMLSAMRSITSQISA